jgi:cell division protein DivIC
MRLIEIINYKKFTLISIFLFLYLILNLLDGERGLISYYNKLELKNELILKKKMMAMELNYIEKKNNLLTNIVDLDYLEILYRKKFMVGKSNETIYKIEQK